MPGPSISRLSSVRPPAPVQWRSFSPSGLPPAPRAYHSLTRIDQRYLLIGGFDGATTFADVFWLLPEGQWGLLQADSLQACLAVAIVNGHFRAGRA